MIFGITDPTQEKIYKLRNAVQSYKMIRDAQRVYDYARESAYFSEDRDIKEARSLVTRSGDVEYFRCKMMTIANSLTKDELIEIAIGDQGYAFDKKRRLAYTKESEKPSRDANGLDTPEYLKWREIVEKKEWDDYKSSLKADSGSNETATCNTANKT